MFKPSRSLNNKGMFLGLEVQDLVFLVVSLFILNSLIPLDELQALHLCVLFVEAVCLSIIRLRFRKGFLNSYFLGVLLNLSDKVGCYVKK